MYRLMFIFFVMVSSVRAEISIQGLPPASGLSFTFMETANTNIIRGQTIYPGAMFLNSQYGYIDHPLTYKDGNRDRDIVSGLQTLDLRGGVLIRDYLNASFNLSLNHLNMPSSQSKYALGDSMAQVKYRITDVNEKVQVAVIPEFYIPLGAENDHLSTGQFGGALRLAITRAYEKFKFSTNIGYRYSPGAVLQNLDYRKQAILGLSTEFAATDKLSINLEGVGFFSTPYDELNSTGEIYLGALWAYSPLTVLTAGFSRSGINNQDNQSFRGILGFKTYFGQGTEKKTGVPQGPAPAAVVQKSCFVEPYTNTFHSRPLNTEEYQQLKGMFPYLTGVRASYLGDHVTMSNLRYGEMTGMMKEDFPFVKDSQIPFAIDMTEIPDMQSIKEVNHAWLKMKVNKVSKDSYLDTEILCSLNFKLCSGETLQENKWGHLFNPRFFDGNQRIVNNKFSKLYLDRPVGEQKGEFLYSRMVTFPLQDIVEGSNVKVKNFFQKAKDGKKTLYFIVADDTFLSNEVSLEVSMGVERCFQKR